MKKRIISFAGQCLTIAYNHFDAEKLINLLFGDLTKKNDVAPSVTTLEIRIDPGVKGISLYSASRCCYHGDSLYALAEILVNEAIYELIRENKDGHTLHAAALSLEGKGILIPGQSGVGKSTLSAWLTYHGFNYLTDELVSISNNPFQIDPFTRPVCLKRSVVASFLNQITIDREKTLEGYSGVMIPHRLLNPDHLPHLPTPTVILFPYFKSGEALRLQKLTGAQCGMKLMGCHVNARNLKDHGFRVMAELSRSVRAYALTYGRFDGLTEAIRSII